MYKLIEDWYKHNSNYNRRFHIKFRGFYYNIVNMKFSFCYLSYQIVAVWQLLSTHCSCTTIVIHRTHMNTLRNTVAMCVLSWKVFSRMGECRTVLKSDIACILVLIMSNDDNASVRYTLHVVRQPETSNEVIPFVRPRSSSLYSFYYYFIIAWAIFNTISI